MMNTLDGRIPNLRPFFSILLLLCASLLLSACNDDDSSTSDDESIAFLSVAEFGSSAIVTMHAARSTIATTHTVASAYYAITDITGDIVFETTTSDHTKHHTVRLDPGEYKVLLTLEMITADADLINTEASLEVITVTGYDEETIVVTDSSATIELDSSGLCNMLCTENLNNEENKAFCFTDLDQDSCGAVYSISLDDLLETAQGLLADLGDDPQMCLRASGAPGTAGSDDPVEGVYTGGAAGDGGIAQTVMNYTDLTDVTDEIFFLVGTDGAATIVTTSDFTDSTSWDYSSIALVGGGGGGGGDGLLAIDGGASYDGGDGSVGGTVSIYTYDSGLNLDSDYDCLFTAGDDGKHSLLNLSTGFEKGGGGGGSEQFLSGTDCTARSNEYVAIYYATGGQTDFIYSDYVGSNIGWSGFGGLITDSPDSINSSLDLSYNTSSATWYNDSDFSTNYDDTFISSGNGSTGIVQSGVNAGNGGAGAGGGAGGAYSSGGGGAGSFGRSYLSVTSTAGTDWCEQDSLYRTNSSSKGGNLQIIFYTGDDN